MRSPAAHDDSQVILTQRPVLNERGFIIGKCEQRHALLVRQHGATRHWVRLWRAAPNRSGQECQSRRSEEHTSELQSLMRISYAVFCLKKKIKTNAVNNTIQ